MNYIDDYYLKKMKMARDINILRDLLPQRSIYNNNIIKKKDNKIKKVKIEDKKGIKEDKKDIKEDKKDIKEKKKDKK